MSFPQLQVEAVARAIHDQWIAHPDYQPWVEGGTSLKQIEARGIAAAALSQVKLELPPHKEEQQDSQNEMRVYQYGVAKGFNECLDTIGKLVDCYV